MDALFWAEVAAAGAYLVWRAVRRWRATSRQLDAFLDEFNREHPRMPRFPTRSRHTGCRCAATAVVLASTVVASAAPASADFLDRHQIAVLQQIGPTICQELDAQPNPFTMGRWVQSLMAVTLLDGWYFLESEAEEIVFASVNNFCTHHQGLFFQYGFVYGD